MEKREMFKSIWMPTIRVVNKPLTKKDVEKGRMPYQIMISYFYTQGAGDAIAEAYGMGSSTNITEAKEIIKITKAVNKRLRDWGGENMTKFLEQCFNAVHEKHPDPLNPIPAEDREKYSAKLTADAISWKVFPTEEQFMVIIDEMIASGEI